jgi:hypothetical protein
MLPDDTYRSSRTLEMWLATQQPLADIEVSRADGSWRARVTPHANNACPFELALRTDQYYDLSIGTETYEDQPIDSLSLFPDLLEAIAAGRVINRRLASAATGTVQAIETIISPSAGVEWSGRRTFTRAETVDVVVSDRHYVAYSRAA